VGNNLDVGGEEVLMVMVMKMVMLYQYQVDGWRQKNN
jgi:hypothetical protein